MHRTRKYLPCSQWRRCWFGGAVKTGFPKNPSLGLQISPTVLWDNCCSPESQGHSLADCFKWLILRAGISLRAGGGMESCHTVTCRGNIITLPPDSWLLSEFFCHCFFLIPVGAEERETNGCHIYYFFKNLFFFSLLVPELQGSFPFRCNMMLRVQKVSAFYVGPPELWDKQKEMLSGQRQWSHVRAWGQKRLTALIPASLQAVLHFPPMPSQVMFVFYGVTTHAVVLIHLIFDDCMAVK